MSTVLPNGPMPPTNDSRRGRPSTRSLLPWGALVLVLHLFFLLHLSGTLDFHLSGPQALRTGPMQTRTLAAAEVASTTREQKPTVPARTRVALVEKPKPVPPPQPNPPPTAPAPKPVATDHSSQTAGSPAPEQAGDSEPATATKPATPDPMPAQEQTTPPDTDDSPEPVLSTVAGPPASSAVVAQTSLTDSLPSSSQSLPMSSSASAPVFELANSPMSPPTPAPIMDKGETSEPGQSPHKSVSANEAVTPLDAPAPERLVSATMALPVLALASLPPSALLSYRLTGQEKGIQYQASGELRWQHNASAYAMSLSVKAFLLGSRHWRSVGQINTTGLAPTRFSDSWRSERAAHFDRPNQRIVFSNNAPTAPLQPGAQDQVSLYAQLAAAMAQSGKMMAPGTRLQIQTATVRDALPWLLTLEKLETLQVDGKNVQAVKWVCQPRNRFDAQVEFWVSATHDWLPARIRITQVSGSFIDLQLTGLEALTDLPPAQ